MQRQYFSDLLTDRHHRIQTQSRFLKDHRRDTAAHAAHLAFA